MRTLPRRRSTLKIVALSLLASLTLLTAVPVFADESSGAAGAMVAGAVFLVMFVVFAVFYIYLALAFQTIAKKTNTENAWWAWVPILQHLLMLNIAKKPVWWIILLLHPPRGHRDCDHRLDGHRRSPQQAKLVGNFDDRARSESDRPRLPGLVRLNATQLAWRGPGVRAAGAVGRCGAQSRISLQIYYAARGAKHVLPQVWNCKPRQQL